MKKISIRMNRGVYEALLFLGLTVGVWLKIVYAQLSTKINDIPFSEALNEDGLFMALWTVIAVMGLIYLIGWKKGVLALWIGALFFGLLIFADTIYGRYYYNPITWSLFNQLYMAGDVYDSAVNLLKVKDVIFIMDYLAIFFFMVLKRHKFIKVEGEINMVYKGIALIAVIGVAGFKFNMDYRKIDTTNYAYERKYMARDLGLIYYHGYDFVQMLERNFSNHELSQEEMTAIAASNNYNEAENAYTGKAEGYNLIVIQLEAFMNFLIDYEVDGVPVTPFLNGFKEESLYMPSCYFQTAGGNTVDAEFMLTTSLLPASSGAVYYEYPTNTYNSLPIALDAKGYVSYSFHGYDASFWNRQVMHKKLGFDRFYSLEDFQVNEIIGWAISDADFYQQSLEKTLDGREADQPFFSFMVTLSSHYPYDGFADGVFTGSEGREAILNRYYNAANYVDRTIEALVDDLKERGLYDNTLLVIYGDHGGLFANEAIAQTVIDGNEYNTFEWSKYQKVPVIIHGKDIFDEGLVMPHVTGQVNILPTVANLLGIEGLYTLGEDVLSNDYSKMVVTRYGNVITDDWYYMSSEDVVYSQEDGEILDKTLYEDQVDSVRSQLDINDLILAGDYFKEMENLKP